MNLTSEHLRKWKRSIFIIFALPGLAFATFISRTPNIRDMLQASTSEMGLIIFGLAAGSLVGLSIASRIIALKGAKFVIVYFCGLIMVLSLLLLSVSVYLSSGLFVFLSLVIFGLGYGLAEVALNVEGAALERATKITFLPALHAGFSAGTLIGAALGTGAVFYNLPIHYHFSLIGVLVGITIFTLSTNIPNGTGIEQRNIASIETKKISVWKDKRLIYIGIIVLGMAFAEGTANDWMPLIMVDGYGVSSTLGATLYSVFVTAMMIGRLSGGYFLDKFGRVSVLRVTVVLAAVGLLLVIFSPNLYLGTVGVILWGLGASLGFPVGLSAAGDEETGASARVGAVATVGYAAFLVGPPFIGFLGEAIGILNALIVIVFLIILSGIFSKASAKPQHLSVR